MRVLQNGTVFYNKTEHVRAYLEGGLRKNPSLRVLLGEIVGGAIGGLVGFAFSAATGYPAAPAVLRGACSGLTLGTIRALTMPRIDNSGLMNSLLSLPAGALAAGAFFATALS
ncbi:MAG: hypothetical protein U0931_13495 [Vulcanimicrobiota bacterium]